MGTTVTFPNGSKYNVVDGYVILNNNDLYFYPYAGTYNVIGLTGGWFAFKNITVNQVTYQWSSEDNLTTFSVTQDNDNPTSNTSTTYSRCNVSMRYNGISIGGANSSVRNDRAGYQMLVHFVYNGKHYLIAVSHSFTKTSINDYGSTAFNDNWVTMVSSTSATESSINFGILFVDPTFPLESRMIVSNNNFKNGMTLCRITAGSIDDLNLLADNKIGYFMDVSFGSNEDDPFNPGGNSGSGGGTGSFDNDSIPVDIPNLPTLSAVDTGFITLFNPTLSELNNLSSYMWSDLFDIDGWRKLFADPMDAILGLSIVPVAVPNGPAKEVKVGNIGTGVGMTTASSQYVSVDCGTLNINEYWGAYLDYDPFTKAEIYLPYVGTHPLAVDDIMGKSLHVVYHVDILSGACCAYLKCGESVLYSFIGQCSSSIPITGDNWTNVINGALTVAGSIGSMVATGGMTAPMAVSTLASAAVNSSKPSIEKSGAMAGTGGMLAIQTPYIILTRPRQALPQNQNSFMGYPSFITSSLSNISGYTEIEEIHLENIPATESEIKEIETLLKGGVIF